MLVGGGIPSYLLELETRIFTLHWRHFCFSLTVLLQNRMECLSVVLSIRSAVRISIFLIPGVFSVC